MDSTQADLVSSKPSSLVRVLTLLAGWPSYLIFAALLLRLCWYGRLPSLPWDGLKLYFLWIAFFLGLWLPVRIAVWASIRPQAGAKRRLGGPIMLACFMFVLGLVAPHAVCRISFELNRPAFDRLAREALAPPSSSGFHVSTRGEYTSRTNDSVPHVGVYEIERVEYRQIGSNAPEEVLIYLAPFGHHVGFAYCPRGRPDDPFLRTSLGGGWYTFAAYSA